MVSRVTSAKSGPRMISWMALSVSRSTAEVAKPSRLGNAPVTEDKGGSHLHPERGSSFFVKERERSITTAFDQRRGTIHPPSQAHPNLPQVLPRTPSTGPVQEPSKCPHLGILPLGRYSLEECPQTDQATGVQWKYHCALPTDKKVNIHQKDRAGRVKLTVPKSNLRYVNSINLDPAFGSFKDAKQRKQE